MLAVFTIIWLFVIATSSTNSPNSSSNIFPHYQFSCDPSTDAYETEFSFLQGLGHGFVHAESNRIYFEYYFPAVHWVAFATADQIILNEKDQCSLCYFTNYYPLSPTNKNHSNLYPKCIEECLDDVIFVATVNSDEQNMAKWSIIEFQVAVQQSKSLQKKMYRIPQQNDLLEIWGEQDYPYRENSHFETEMLTISEEISEEYFVHARFWRQYNYGNNTSTAAANGINEWKPFVVGPYDNAYADTFCFISIGSYGGAYPYTDDIKLLPTFYIDTQHLANIHCYKTNDIKLNCGGDMNENETNPETKLRTDDLGDDESEIIGELNTDEKEEILKKDLYMLDPNTGCFLQGPISGFIANCADDNCENHESLDSAIDKCLEESSCTGVVQIVSGQSIYQLRSDKILRDSPRGEVTWVKLCGEKALVRIKEIAAETNPENKMRTDDLVDNNNGNIQNKYEEYVAQYFAHDTDLHFDNYDIHIHMHSTMIPTAKPTVKPTAKPTDDNTVTSYWIQETIQRKDFDMIIGSHDFTFINFCATWSINCRRFVPEWSDAVDKSNGMIFNDQNGKQISVKLLHINCVTYLDLCSSIGIRAYPTIRLYRRSGIFVPYHGERNKDALFDKLFVESGTEIKSDNNLDEYPQVYNDFGTDYEQYLDGNDDTVEYDGNAFDSVNYRYYYGGILIACIGIIGVIILYWMCFNKKQTDKEAKEQILMYDSTKIQTNFGEQEGI